jgi:hypothetical protein
VTGRTTNSDFPTTPGAFDTTFGGFTDGFVTKIAEALTSTPGKVTGGGLIQPDGTVSAATLLIRFGNNATVGSKATFGFNVRFNGGANPTGNLTYTDRSAGVRIKALSFRLLVIGDGACGPRTHARFIGSASVSGASGTSTQNFEAEADDCGQAGSSPSPDTFRITTMGTTSYAAAGPVLGGNIQIHKN